MDASILSTPLFCGHRYFVDAYILSTPIFCLHLYFVATYVSLNSQSMEVVAFLQHFHICYDLFILIVNVSCFNDGSFNNDVFV